jgi:hypothetical protein
MTGSRKGRRGRQAVVRRGDRVRFLIGLRQVEGVVVEDRGPIGVGGRHLYRVDYLLAPDFPTSIELPAEEMKPVDDGSEDPRPTKVQIPNEQSPFAVGDRVQFSWDNACVQGVIVEDRGPIGVGGRRLFRIEFRIDPDDEGVIELPAEEIQRAT